MKIGMIGAGDIALGVAKYALQQGHEVHLSNRSADKLAKIVTDLGKGAFAASREDAASAELVLLAVNWESVPDALLGLPAWNNRILIDATNPFLNPAPLNILDDLHGRLSSEIVQDLAPGARLVKAFNTIFATKLHEGPRHAGARRVIFVSGDDAAAKTTVMDLIASFGFAPVDLGNLKEGGRMQQAHTAPLAGPDFLLPD